MIVRKLMLVSAGVIGLSGTAYAADLPSAPIEAPAVTLPLAFDWTGFYVGAQIGYAWGNSDTDFTGGFTTSSTDPDGVVGGVHIGYNAQFNQIVVGLEGDIEASSMSGDESSGGAFGSTSSVDVNWQGSVRARLGYAMDNVLPYITGGVAFADVDVDSAITGFSSSSYSDTLTGWTVGAGVEYAFTQNITGRVEYRYTDFGDTNGEVDGGETASTDLKTHAVRVGISYKF
jgi:outer membrane immunogenic protein